MDEWKEKLRVKLAELGCTIEKLFAPPFAWTEIATFLSASIKVAEEFYHQNGTGPSKRELVMEIWDHYDNQYNLVNRLDELVDFKAMLGGFVGGIVEKFDSGAIRGAIERVIIPLMVGQLFPNYQK